MASVSRLPHAIAGAVVAIVIVLCGVVQVASDSLYSNAPLAKRSFGLAVYTLLDRVAPAAYVEDTLAHAALADGNLDLAQHYAIRMESGSRRDDLLAQIASARGENSLAFEYDFAAADTEALNSYVMMVAKTDPRAAYALEVPVLHRIAQLGGHPDALAEANFIAGSLSSWTGRPADAYAYFQQATALAPFNIKYVLATANQALTMNKPDDAERLFRAAIGVDPASGDALCGLGLVALRNGDRVAARRYLMRAIAAQPDSAMIAVLRRAMQ